MPKKEITSANESLIRAYGLYWVRSVVDWDARKLPGLRMSSKLTNKNQVSKKRTVEAWKQRGVYALYSNARLVYVGLADSNEGIGDRLHAHYTKPRLSGRWDTFSWFGVNGFDTEGQFRDVQSISSSPPTLIRTMELLLILAADPIMNRASGRFAGAERINQTPEVDPVTNVELKKLLLEIKASL